jgi:N6-adenosine-specific RNA methylase IME4
MNVAALRDDVVAGWAVTITAAWGDTVEGIIEVGKLLIEARNALSNERGEWGRLIGDNGQQSKLPFGYRTAYRLIEIAEDERILTHVSVLPPSWGTLHALTKLNDEQFATAIQTGAINPEMERSDARAIRILDERPSEADDGCTVSDLNLIIKAAKKFSVIYADPPWSFKVYSGKGKQRSVDRHYDTQSLDDIKALPVSQWADTNCALMLWAVLPQLPEALDLIKAWVFTYKTTAFVWVKENEKSPGWHWGMGYWTRANAELVLFATKGEPRRQAMDVHQLIVSPVSYHSRKPDEVQERIERLLPGPYLELYGRRATPGWTVWGNQITRSLFHQSIPEFEVA